MKNIRFLLQIFIIFYALVNMNTQKYDLFRFKSAQRDFFDKALNELKFWVKQSSWIWYIFPQIAWLWHSEISKKYSISCLEEAIEYYNDDELRNNLETISQALLNVNKDDPVFILWNIDAMKVQSCMTLFHKVDPKNKIFIDVLNKYYNWKLDEKTLEILWE